MMKAKLRRVYLRIDVTTETGERRPVILSHQPEDGALRGPLLLLVLGAMAASGLELVTEAEQPIERPTPPAPPLTVAAAPAASDSGQAKRLPSVPAVSPSTSAPAGADSLPPVKPGSVKPRQPAPAPPPAPANGVIRIEAGPAGPRADHVVGPRTVQREPTPAHPDTAPPKRVNAASTAVPGNPIRVASPVQHRDHVIAPSVVPRAAPAASLSKASRSTSQASMNDTAPAARRGKS
jgi:hypothetical protein